MNTCPSCGAPLENNVCPYCGASYQQAAPAQPSAQPQASPEGVQPQQTVVYINQTVQNDTPQNVSTGTKGHPVKKWVYCLLAFFLGDFGIHKFYCGMTGKGIAYLVFCWTGIPYLISWVECVIALFKKSDENGMISFG